MGAKEAAENVKTRTSRRIDTAEELVLEIEVKRASMEEFLLQAYGAVAASRNVQVHAGESAREACEHALSEPIATELATNAVMNMAYPFARSDADDVVTVGSPLLTPRSSLTSDEPFEFTARWAKLPQVELSSYDPVEITAPPKAIPDGLVEQQIAAALAAHARFEPSDEVRPVQEGDTVSLALHTTLDGAKVEGLCFDGRTFTTGIGAMPDDFERNIVGMQPGESKDFRFEGIAGFEADESPILKTYEAHADVKALLESVSPELTDAWVTANVPGCQTVAEFRAMMSDRVSEQVAAEYRHYLNYIAASELAKRFEGHIPDVAYEAMRDELQAQFDQEAAQLGLTREEYMEQQGADEQQYSVRMILQIRERLVQSIALDAYARHFGLEVTDADLDEFFATSAPHGAAAELRRQMEGSGRMYLAYEGARRLKANDRLVANARITQAE